jgi:myosin heavy subunit
MDDLRNEIDESAVLTEHFILKRNRALKELVLLKDKIRTEEDRSYANRRQTLENEYKQTLIQLKDLTRRFEELDKFSKTNQAEMNQLNDLYKKLEDELHDLVLNNMRLECNLRTIEEQTLLTKAIYETEKSDLANEQIKQQQFYTNELDKAIDDIKRDFQVLLKNNKVILENAYTERIEQVKTQITTYQSNKQQESPTTTTRISIETLHDDLKQIEKSRDEIENEYRPLIDLYLNKQKEKNQIDEERIRLDNEYNRLITEINQLTEAIEIGKQYWFSVHFELETYRRLLDLESTKTTINHNHTPIVNGKEENGIKEEKGIKEEQRSILTVKKTDSQRSISKTGEIKRTNNKHNHTFQEGSILTCNIILGKFDIDQVQAGFISINNAATHCVDQPLKGWTLVRSLNDAQESIFQFPDTYILKARTRVRVYSNKADNTGNSAVLQGRLVASSIPAWASTGQGDNVKILLLDEKGINKAQYSETWQ